MNDALTQIEIQLKTRKTEVVLKELERKYSPAQIIKLCYALIKAKRITHSESISKIARYQEKQQVNV